MVIMQISGGSTNLDRNGEHALVWHQMCDRSEKPDELKSPVIECAIQVIHVYN